MSKVAKYEDTDYLRNIIWELHTYYPKANFEDYTGEFDSVSESVCLQNMVSNVDNFCNNCPYDYTHDVEEPYLVTNNDITITVYCTNYCTRQSLTRLK